VVFYRCAEADDINLSKTGIDFANEVCLREVRVKGEGSGVWEKEGRRQATGCWQLSDKRVVLGVRMGGGEIISSELVVWALGFARQETKTTST